MVTFKEFMLFEKPVNRWFVAKVFLVGFLCGTVLTVLWMLNASFSLLK